MAKLCPVCRKNRMHLGGMAVQDGAICSKCWDRLKQSHVSPYQIKRLTIPEVEELFERKPKGANLSKSAAKQMEERKSAENNYAPIMESFRKDYREFFLQRGVPENTAIQKDVTQFLWHKLVLQKRRLDRQGLTLHTEIQRKNIQGTVPIVSQKFFDGKYEIATVRETVEGTRTFQQGANILHRDRAITVSRYRMIQAKEVGSHKIICPSCGHTESRTNLLDGCDYCGTRFTIEDLGLRISENQTENDWQITAQKEFYANSAGRGGFSTGIVIFCLSLVAMLLNVLTEGAGIGNLLTGILGCLVFAALMGLLGAFIHEMIFKPSALAIKEGKGQDQSLARQKAESERKNGTLLKIRKHDPLFSAEGFYSEIENMLSAVHYAEKPEEMSTFWESPDEEQLKSLIEKYQAVIQMDVKSVQMTDYFVENNLQKVTAELVCVISEAQKRRVVSREERIRVSFVKNAACVTESICAPSFLKCRNCGASVSLMEGCRCSYCGTAPHLSEMAWAIQDYSII